MKKQAAQVYYDLPEYIKLKIFAKKKKKKPLATWIRDVTLREYEKENKTKKKLIDLPTFNWDVGDRNLSEHIDDVVYGDM